LLAASAFAGFRKGLSREVIGLVSVLLALVLGIWFYGWAGSLLAPYITSHRGANVAGFVLVFIIVMMAGTLTSFAVGKLLRVTGLSFFDHLLGAVFGLLRGSLIAVALMLGILAFSSDGKAPQVVVHSRLAPYLVEAAHLFASIAPHELKQDFRRTYAEVREVWQSTVDPKIHSRAQTGRGY
jgi:membrane protein required for colicin V production